ncbi:MAG: restriction endonuclease subunit S [Candidatus Cryptobacteroides sp.]
MSEISDMIQRLCPDGVEYRKLGEICEIKTGKGITQKDCSDDGKYPVISGGQGSMGVYHEWNRPENTVTISRVGAYAGFVNFIYEKFYLNDKCFSVICTKEGLIEAKYLYYCLKNREASIIGLQSEGGVPTINTQKVANIEIPVPPLEVQRKIVEILDNFSELTAELEAELEARQKQYEYYRDNLLNFNRGGASR